MFGETHLFTLADKTVLPDIAALNESIPEIAEFFEEMSFEFEEAPLAIADGLRTLHTEITALDDSTVLLVNIG